MGTPQGLFEQALLEGQAFGQLEAGGGGPLRGRDRLAQLAEPREAPPQGRQQARVRTAVEGRLGLVDVGLRGLEPAGQERSLAGLGRDEAQQAAQREVEPVARVGLGAAHGRLGVDQGEERLGRAGVGLQLAGRLGAVRGPRQAAQLLGAAPEQRVVPAGSEARRRRAQLRGSPARAALVQPAGLPGAQPGPELLGKARRVGRGAEGLAGQARGGQVVAVLAAGLERQREDQVGPEGAHARHHVAQGALAPPAPEGLVHAEREAELEGPREELLGAVEAVSGLQLLAAQQPQRFEELGPQRVLATLATGQGQQPHAQASAARELGQHAVGLVVGVGRDVQHAAGHRQPPQGQPQADAPVVDRELRLRGETGERRRQGHGAQDGPGGAPAAQDDGNGRPDAPRQDGGAL